MLQQTGAYRLEQLLMLGCSLFQSGCWVCCVGIGQVHVGLTVSLEAPSHLTWGVLWEAGK